MNIEHSNGVGFYSFSNLSTWRGLIQAAFTREGGVSGPPYETLNASYAVQDDPEKVSENLSRMARAVGWAPERFLTVRQVHGRGVLPVDRRSLGRDGLMEADALVTDDTGVLLLLKFADCVPVVLWDPVRRVVGLVHAGWKGTVLGAPAAALELMEERYGTRPSDVLAGIGPSIGPCCYEIGPEVESLATQAFSAEVILQQEAGGRHFDLWRANCETLMLGGVPRENVEVAGICTRCHHDLFFSHRAAGGLTGRFGAVVGLSDE